MIIKQIKLNFVHGSKLIEIIQDYESRHIIEGIKYFEEDNNIFIRFANIFDYDRLLPAILNNKLRFDLDKVIAYREEIKEEYQYIIEKYLD